MCDVNESRPKPGHKTGEPMWALDDDTARAEWVVDPTAESLQASAWRDPRVLPKPFCIEVGRRVLLAQLQASEWILRRTEKLDLTVEQAVRRTIALEFLVPNSAPVFIDHDGRRLRLVPLSLMRRRTLIGLRMRDEDGRALTLPGLRLTQQLDQSVLLAAAASRQADDWQTSDNLSRAEVQDWIVPAVSGTLHQVQRAYNELAHAEPDSTLGQLRADDLFMNTANRLRHNFTLYLLLDEDDGRHRLLTLQFEEPTDWRYQRPRREEVPSGSHAGEWRYAPGQPSWRHWRAVLARVGLASTRLRFQIPGAEYAASYHVELAAPPGICIVEATLLAGRPNDPDRHISIDQVVGHAPTVGLHALEIPNGSLCRLQGDFRVTARGWLSTMTIATLVIFLLLVTVVVHEWPDGPRAPRDETDTLEITNAILLLVSAAGAAATMVAQRDFSGMAARLVAGLRAAITAALALPVIAAGILIYAGRDSNVLSPKVGLGILIGLTGLACMFFILTLLAWLGSWRHERRPMIQESPWDMTRFSEDVTPAMPELWKPDRDFNVVTKEAKFNTAAVGIGTAEGWHSRYSWTDDAQIQAVDILERRNWLGHCRESDPSLCQRKGLTCALKSPRPSTKRTGAT